MPRSASPRPLTNVLGNNGTSFVANRDKVVDKPRPKVFQLGHKKMYTSPLAQSASSPISQMNSLSADVKSPVPYHASTPPSGKRIVALPTSPASPSAVAPVVGGPIPYGKEMSVTGDRGIRGSSAPKPVSKCAEDVSSGIRCTNKSNQESAGENNTVFVRSSSGSAAYDKGKRTKMDHPTEVGETKLSSHEQYAKSQRYCTSPLRSLETINTPQPEHKPSIHVKAAKESLVGVMKAAPLPPPKEKSAPAPWEQSPTGENGKMPPRARRASPFRAAVAADGFSCDSPSRRTGLRCNSPSAAAGGASPTTGVIPTFNGVSPRPSSVRCNGTNSPAPQQKTSIVSDPPAQRPSGRRHHTPTARSQSPFALHI